MDDMVRDIDVLIMDVDGVLTDGKIVLDSLGRELKFFDVKDGFAISQWHKAGKKSAIISARSSRAVTVRARNLQIGIVHQNASTKMDFYEKILKEFNVTDERVCYIGDDILDAAVIQRAGLGVAVADAAGEVRDVADYVTRRNGGNGAVREVIEIILKSQGRWLLS